MTRERMFAIFISMIGLLAIWTSVLVVWRAPRTDRQINQLVIIMGYIADQAHIDALNAYTACLNNLNAYNNLAIATKASVPLRTDVECGPEVKP